MDSESGAELSLTSEPNAYSNSKSEAESYLYPEPPEETSTLPEPALQTHPAPEPPQNPNPTPPLDFTLPQPPEPAPPVAVSNGLIHSELDDLPLATREKIIELVDRHTYDIVTEIVIAPAPHGLGIKTSKASIKRFVNRYNRGQLKSQREQAAREAAEIAAQADNPATLAAATSHLLRHRLLTLVHADAGPSTLLQYVRALDILAATDHAERRLRLAESKAAHFQK